MSTYLLIGLIILVCVYYRKVINSNIKYKTCSNNKQRDVKNTLKIFIPTTF